MSSFSKIKAFVMKNERRISSLALIAGFVFDSLTLKRIDMLYENIVIISYLLIAAFGILMINLLDEKILNGKFFQGIHSWFFVLLQFAFGGLFSAFTIFYMRSASLASSWLFIAILAGLLLGNELFRKRYSQLAFQLSIYFIAVYFFTIFSLPVLVGSMSSLVFIASGILSLCIISLFVWGLSRFVGERLKQNWAWFVASIGTIFFAINMLYFQNIIPPIPLSLNQAGIHHSLEQIGNVFAVETESQKAFRLRDTFHIRAGDPLYAFSAVFAPTSIRTDIVHHWQYYDETKKEWLTLTKVKYRIIGGRDGGYRGFSSKTNVAEGLWRVNVETLRGQTIGTMKFNVIHVLEKPNLERKML